MDHRPQRRIRTGSLYLLRPVGQDACDFRISYWKDHLVRVIRSDDCCEASTVKQCCVETRRGDYIGPVLIASLQPLDRNSKNALRREARRTSHIRK